MLSPIGVAVDRHSGEIRRVVKLGRGVPSGDSGIAGRTLTQGQRRAQRAVSILVVEWENAITGVLRGTNGETAQRGRSSGVGNQIERLVCARSPRYRCASVAGAFSRKDLNDSGYGIRAVQDTRRPSHDLDAIDVV